jgi:hypothetical protein
MPFVHCDGGCGNQRCPHGLCIVCFMRHAVHLGPSRYKVKPENFLPGREKAHMRVWSCSPPPTGMPRNNFFPPTKEFELLPPAAPRGIAVHVWDALDNESERVFVEDNLTRFFTSSLPNFYGSVTSYKHVTSLQSFAADASKELGDDGSLPLELIATMLVAHVSPSRHVYFNKSSVATSDVGKALARAVRALDNERAACQQKSPPPHIVIWLVICSMERKSKEVNDLVLKLADDNATVVLFERAPGVMQCQTAFAQYIESVRRSPAGADPVQQVQDATKNPMLAQYKPYLYSRGKFVDVVAQPDSAHAVAVASDDKMQVCRELSVADRFLRLFELKREKRLINAQLETVDTEMVALGIDRPSEFDKTTELKKNAIETASDRAAVHPLYVKWQQLATERDAKKNAIKKEAAHLRNARKKEGAAAASGGKSAAMDTSASAQ